MIPAAPIMTVPLRTDKHGAIRMSKTHFLLKPLMYTCDMVKPSWLIAITMFIFVISPIAAQDDVTLHQPVDGRFVRGSNDGQPARQLGLVDVNNATWTPIQVAYSNRTRPLWSPNGQYIAYGLPSPHSAILEVASGTITFTTEQITDALTPFDINGSRGWSADSQSLAITYAQVDALSSFVKLYDVDFIAYTIEEYILTAQYLCERSSTCPGESSHLLRYVNFTDCQESGIAPAQDEDACTFFS